jgi:RNA polymerase sigma-70 factor (ECF subfamily)
MTATPPEPTGPEDPSDADLVDAVRRGDPAAFEALYRRHRDWAAAVAFRFCGSRDDALDVLQDAFVYLARKIPGLRLRCRLRTFLYPAVKHLALARKEAARRMAPVESVPDRPVEPEEPDEIEAMLRELPEGEREVVLLRSADGMDLEEIAGALEIPLGTVKSRLHSALERLRTRRKPF